MKRRFTKYPSGYVRASSDNAYWHDYKMAGLRDVLRKFDSNGKFAKSGHWHIANGGYDLDWELYYDDVPVVQCIAGELENGHLPDFAWNKVRNIILSEYPDIQE